MATLLEQLGQRIKEARLAKQWTQKDVAIRIGVSRTLISSIEHGAHNPSITTVCDIAKSLGITIEIPPGED